MKTHTQPRTLQRIESVSVGSYHYDTCTPSQPFPYCLQPFLDGRGVQNAATVGKLNQTRNLTLPSHPTTLQRQKTCNQVPQAQLEKQTTAPDRGSSHPRRSETSEPPRLFFVQERTARMIRKRAQHEVLHIVLTFIIGGVPALLSV